MHVSNAYAALQVEVVKNLHFRGQWSLVWPRKIIHPAEGHTEKIAHSTEETVAEIFLIFTLKICVSETHITHLSETMNFYPANFQSVSWDLVGRFHLAGDDTGAEYHWISYLSFDTIEYPCWEQLVIDPPGLLNAANSCWFP